jgi:SagB-type dehydrogenase family enzyme
MFYLDPRLLIYSRNIGTDTVFVAEINCSDPPLVLKDPVVAMALHRLPERFSRDQAGQLWNDLPLGDVPVGTLWDALYEAGVILSAEDQANRHPSAQDWHRFGWNEAYSYQYATRDYPFVQMNTRDGFREDQARMVQFLSEGAPPDIYQSVTSTTSIPLARHFKQSKPSEVFDMLSIEQRRGVLGLSFRFDTCFGERSTEPFDAQGRFLRKAIPSGGARHPTEIFFVAFAFPSIPPGVYHYNVQAHGLDCVQSGSFYAETEDATFDLFRKYDDKPLGLFIFTSLHERAMWRYRDSRSWRATMIDIGHALMAFRMISNKLGFQHYTYQKFKDQKVCDLLRINPLRQSPYFVGTLV